MEKVYLVLAYFTIAVIVLVTLPYWLYLAWVRIISLKRKARHLDFDCRGW